MHFVQLPLCGHAAVGCGLPRRMFFPAARRGATAFGDIPSRSRLSARERELTPTEL